MGWLIVIGGYLLGSWLPAETLVRWRTGHTPQELRDNPGIGGAWRMGGPLVGIIVTALDPLKGALPVLLSRWLDLGTVWVAAAAAAPVAGHAWPLMKVIHGQAGGRGLGPATGALFVLAWRELLPGYVLGALVALWLRWLPIIGVIAFIVGIGVMWYTAVPSERFVPAVAVMLVVTIRNAPMLLVVLKNRGSELPH